MKINDYEVTVHSNNKLSFDNNLIILDRDTLQKLLKALDDYTPKFKIGDFVKATKRDTGGWGFNAGEYGKIVFFTHNGSYIGVEFAHKSKEKGTWGNSITSHYPTLYDASGKKILNNKPIVAGGHGAMISPDSLELVE